MGYLSPIGKEVGHERGACLASCSVVFEWSLNWIHLIWPSVIQMGAIELTLLLFVYSRRKRGPAIICPLTLQVDGSLLGQLLADH